MSKMEMASRIFGLLDPGDARLNGSSGLMLIHTAPRERARAASRVARDSSAPLKRITPSMSVPHDDTFLTKARDAMVRCASTNKRLTHRRRTPTGRAFGLH